MKNHALTILISTMAVWPFLASNATAAILPNPAAIYQTAATPTAKQTLIPCTIAFDSNRDGNRDVYSMSPDGSHTVNLTHNPAQDESPVWSPDGSQIAFVSNRENDKEGGQFIYMMDADGSNVRQLNAENESKWPDWSHDGTKITYTNKGDIYVINADGSGISVNLTNSPQEDSQSTWSPDGSQLAWLSGAEGNRNVFVMNADGKGVRQITDNGQVGRVEWTFDGRLFTDWGWKNQKEFCHNCLVEPDGSHIMDAGGKGEVEKYSPLWTDVGKVVGVANVDAFAGNNEIYLVSKDFPDPQGIGAGFINLTNNPADDRYPDWPANCGLGKNPVIFDEKPATTAGNILLGFAGKDTWNSMREQDFQSACDELGIQCVYGDIPTLLERKVDAIIQDTSASSVEKLRPSIEMAKKSDTPVFILDAETDIEGTYNVTIDKRQAARMGLEWLFKKIGGQGQIAYFNLGPEMVDANVIQDVLSGYPGINVVEHRDGDYDPEKVKPESVDFAIAYPDLKAIWTNINKTPAILGLEKATDLPHSRWPAVTCDATMDGLDVWARMEQADPKFDCLALANPPGIAYEAVYAAYYLATGVQIDKSALGGKAGNTLYVDIPMVTRENRQQWQAQLKKDSAFYVDERMSPEKIRERWFLE